MGYTRAMQGRRRAGVVKEFVAPRWGAQFSAAAQKALRRTREGEKGCRMEADAGVWKRRAVCSRGRLTKTRTHVSAPAERMTLKARAPGRGAYSWWSTVTCTSYGGVERR